MTPTISSWASLSRVDIAASSASPSPQAGGSGGGSGAELDVALDVDDAAVAEAPRCLTKYTLATATAAMTMHGEHYRNDGPALAWALRVIVCVTGPAACAES